jgi:hypothetical protein
VLLLGGCLGEGTAQGMGFLSPKVKGESGGASAAVTRPMRKPLARASLAGGRVVVAGPRGYCIDPGTLKTRPTGGFALLAACGALGAETGHFAEPVLMTVQVQPRLLNPEAPDTAAMTAALAPARVLRQEDGDGVSLVQVGEGGDKALPGGDPRHWRGAMVINGHLVGLAVYAPESSPMAGKDGRGLILALAEALREASPVKDYTPRAAALQPPPADAADPAKAADARPRAGGLGQLFPKLFQ